MTRSEAGRLGATKTSAAKRQNALDAYYANPNKCDECCCVITVPAGVRPGLVRKKKFCSLECAETFKNKKKSRQERKCAVCSTLLKRGTKYCSNSCQGVERSSNATCHGAVRRRLMEGTGSKCWKCGWNELNPITGKCPLVMNHIDGNSSNMNEENLEILCPNCDSLTSTYKSLNRGNGRHYRKIRYQQGKSY